VRRRFPALGDELLGVAGLLRGHLARRPRENPIQAFRAVFPRTSNS
jgi:hypothetical protein